MASYYNPSKRLSEWAAALLSPYITLENEGNGDGTNDPAQHQATSLSVGLWSGNVELKNVQLRPETFEPFLNNDDYDAKYSDSTAQIKWKLIEGSISNVKIQIPWKGLLVGSAYSSAKCSALGNDTKEGTGEGKKKELPGKTQGEDESAGAAASGCTSIHIQGLKLLLGYEIIHHDPHLNALQSEHGQNGKESVSSDTTQLQGRIREEKDRILQTAERRLLAGLDPFPPSLMDGLQSVMASSIQSRMQSSIKNSIQPDPLATTATPVNASNDDNASIGTTITKSTASSYRSRMENYLSSTIKSLLWRVFDSLFFSVTQVKLSVVGCSHYDRDFASLLRKERAKAEEKKHDEKMTDQQQKQHQQQEQRKRPKHNVLSRNFPHRRMPKFQEDQDGNEARHPYRRLSSRFDKRGTGSKMEDDGSEENIHPSDCGGSINENPSIWAREGQVEVGVTLDRFDVRPGPLKKADLGAQNNDNESALKLIHFRGMGVFLRRKHAMSPGGDGSLAEDSKRNAEGHTGKTLVWIDMNYDDYIADPVNMEATCQVYHNVSGSSTVGLEISPPQKKERESPDAISKASTTGVSVESKGTETTRRRGKREKRKKVAATEVEVSRPPLLPTQLALPPPGSSIPLKQSRRSIISGNASLSTSTSGVARVKRAHFQDDSFSSPHRIKLSLEMGHIQISVSPRHLYFIHSLSSSMARMKRGRPRTTIRAARAHDVLLLKHMTDEGQSMIAREDHIYRAVPSLQTRPSLKSLPGVVSSWWKYACINVLNEIQEQNILLANVGSTSRGRSKKGNGFMRSINSQRAWDWAKQSRIRREYIDQYYFAHATSSDEVAVSGAKFRLKQLEDDLNIERILLLKNVARAAASRARADGVPGQTLELSLPDDMYFCFPLKTNSNEAHQRWKMDTMGSGKEESDSRAVHHHLPLSAAMRDSTVVSGNAQSIVGQKTPSDSLSFSINLSVSGITLALCDFGVGDGELSHHTYTSDDISTLTGYSDDDPKTPIWSAYCQPILSMHIANILYSKQTECKNELHLPLTESEFSVGGLSIQTGCSTPQRNIFCLGCIRHGESLRAPPHRTIAPNESSVVSGYSDLTSAVINVGPTEISLDWGWLEKILKFASTNTYIGPSRVAVPLESEDLLVRTFSNPLKKTSANSISMTVEFDMLSLTIPVHCTEPKDEKGFLFLVTTANHLTVKVGNLHDSLSNESDNNIGSIIKNDCDMLLVLEGFDTVIQTKNDPTSESNITRLLRCPLDIRFQSSPSKGICSLENPHHYSCQSYDVRLSAINLLVSEGRLRTLKDLVETFSDIFIDAGDTLKVSPHFLKPSMPALAEFVLEECKVSIQSLGFHMIPEEDDCATGDSHVQEQLEDNISAFISQLSCLDVKYPNQNAVACMSRLFIDRCCALGMAKNKARECAETGRTNFNREARALFHFASNLNMAKGRRQKSNRRFAETPLSMNPETLSDTLDQVVAEATLATIADIGDVLLQPDSNHLKHVLSVDIESVVVSRSLLYCGNTLEISINSFTVRDGQVSLLSVHPHSWDIKANQLSSDISSVETDEALTISLQERGAAQGRECRQEIYFEAGCVELLFAPEQYLDAMKVCSNCISSVKSGTPADSINLPEETTKDVLINGNISSFTFTLTADKLLPFIECQIRDVAVQKCTILGSHATSKASLQAGTIDVDCVCQSTYPDIISTHKSSKEENFNESSAFSAELTSHHGSDADEILICLDGVRIMLLKQVLDEISQYISSPNYGIGLFLSHIESEEEAANNADPAAPSKLKMVFNSSSFIFPRDSSSMDMLAFEVETLTFSPKQVAESWSIDRHSFSDNGATQLPDKREHQFASSSSSEVYFDCISQVQASSSPEDRAPPQITRYVVHMSRAHMFTALNKHHFSSKKAHMPELNANVQNTGRAEHGKPVYVERLNHRGKLNKSMSEEIGSRAWEKITKAPLYIGITADYAPMLRLMIEDYSDAGSCGVSLELRMSQFYLLMSVSFSNLQELPIFFPYDSDFVEKYSVDPDPPLDWPEYGTKEFVERLKCGSNMTSEMAICFKKFSWRCSYDKPNYFTKPPTTMSMMSNSEAFISIEFDDFFCGKMTDEISRLGIGATSMKIIDGRQSEESFTRGLCTSKAPRQISLVDLNWGLDCGRHTLIDGLPLPFQVTVFTTPDQHCMVNLGLDMDGPLAEVAFADLNSFYILNDYFGLYFNEPAYGNPTFEAESLFRGSTGDTVLESLNGNNECLSIDFRLWMVNPHVVIPSPSEEICVMIEADGLYYRYKSFGLNYSSQDVVAKDLAIVVLSEYMEPSISRGLRQVSGSLSSCGVRTLFDGLSFSLRYDYNESINYTRFALRAPLTSQHFGRPMDGIESSNIEPQPFLVPPPLLCKPFAPVSRSMGHNETCIYFSQEYMSVALEILTAFVGSESTNHEVPEATGASDLPIENIFSLTVHVEKVKFVISDPVMGMHRPILSVCLPELLLTASQLNDAGQDSKAKIDKLTGLDPHANAKDLQASMEATMFIDYFKLGLTRNWEPFVEPFKCLILHERSASRGKGITFNSDCPLHLNVTGALIETIDDALKTFDLFRPKEHGKGFGRYNSNSEDEIVKSASIDDQGHNLIVQHTKAMKVEENQRIAFSLKNTTGERVRVHAHSALEKDLSSCRTTIAYLDHLHLMPLSFPATETAIKNLLPVEVPFEGDQNIASLQNHHRHQNVINTPTSHEIDLQLPGFRWVHGINFDKTGKRFVELIPRSPSINEKIDNDWRLKNALHILAEVNSINGGRRLTVTSPFEVVNKTNHPIFLAINPDPCHSPPSPFNDNLDSSGESNQRSNAEGFVIDKLNPEQSHNISVLLMESSLLITGKHLGSIWIRPDQSTSNDNVPVDPFASGSTIGYPSRPIQLAKILHESSVILKDSSGDASIANQVASGVEVSCPIFDTISRTKTRSNIPFCYVIEVKRSPFMKATQVETEALDTDAGVASPVGKLKTAKNKFQKNTGRKTEIHTPIAYSLVIHPPLVIENLLPERGRFELMDATGKNVLWFRNLDAGERVSVFTVGLDAPLVLLVNLGFCRTGAGEGALIHHGGGGGGLFKAGWNAFKTQTDRVKKTLSTITESKDHRGAKIVQSIMQGNVKHKDSATNRKTGQLGFNTENEMIEDSAGGPIKRGDGYGVEDIATELNVIDSLGQRLTLLIDNVLGSGGQRRVSLYCPFWIANTTSHSLQYKQEKAQSYVSGTVHSPERDGSKSVDGSYRCDIIEDKEDQTMGLGESELDSLSTIFSGRPGAMSLLNDLEDNDAKPSLLAALISKDLPLHALSKLSFMFNFQDILGASERLCLQLVDTTTSDGCRYTSAWSSGFGLESVGVTQIVGMHCKDGRGLEVSVSICIAPGRLSNYTKIVRICPRYVVVNQLPSSIRLWQDNSVVHPNLAVEHNRESNESDKWIFTNDQGGPDDAINQYELLFGSPALIECNKEMGAQTAAHKDACYIATVLPSEFVAFHLPDTRLERLLRVDIGPVWHLSPSFAADVPGEYVLSMDRARDLRMLPHVSSRGAPVYTISLSSTDDNWSGELGVWFESGWEGQSLIVKGIKEGSYASIFTDMIIGDELIMIDAMPVERLTFEEAMKYLKLRLAAAKDATESRVNQSPVRSQKRATTMMAMSRHRSGKKITDLNNFALTFLTLEERLRRLRRAAVSKNVISPSSGQNEAASNALKSKEMVKEIDHSASPEHSDSSTELLVEMKFLFQSVFIFLRTPDPTDSPHRVINRSLHWRIYYRQRLCEAHPWKCLSPGESSPYTWEEPMKPKNLSVRVGVGEYIQGELNMRNSFGIGMETTEGISKGHSRPFFSFQFTENEEQGHFGVTRTVKLEEIGYTDNLPLPSPARRVKNESSLHCQVDTEGSTRVLIVYDELAGKEINDKIMMRCHLANIRSEIAQEESRWEKINALKKSVNAFAENIDDTDASTKSLSPTPAVSTIMDNVEVLNLQELVDHDEGRFITRDNQVRVEVLEATGLRSSNLNGLSNPYVKVGLVCTNRKRRNGSFSKKVTRSTYYVEKTLSPQWCDQSFIFDAPAKAISDPRETRCFSIQCSIKSAQRLEKDKFLGQAHVHLRNLTDQKENVGWYPLMGKLGQSDVGKDPLDRICGSIRLRVQWVYDTPGLLDYYLLCSNRRLGTLRKSKEGMKRQIKSLQDTVKLEEERRESVSFAKVPALAAIYKTKKTLKRTLTFEPDLIKKDIKGVLSKEGRLKKTLQSARSLTKSKRLKRSAICYALDSFSDNMDDIDFGDGSSSDETLDSRQVLADGNDDSSSSGSLTSSNDNNSSSEVSLRLSCPQPSTCTCSMRENSRLLYLRWQNWGHYTSIVPQTTHPFYSSWNISRAFINGNAVKPLQRKVSSPIALTEAQECSKMVKFMVEFLKLPPEASQITVERENNYVRELMRSRVSFSKAARRSLGSVLNTGGILTIRPITALNLPENYTGMFVKLRYGNLVRLSETVDSKVAPVWTDRVFEYSHTKRRERRDAFMPRGRSNKGAINDFKDIAEMINPTRASGSRESDLNIQVEPFETSRSLRLTVIGERANVQSKVAIGVLEIPLGPALECCASAMEDYEEDRNSGNPKDLPPAYVRWFPLMSPSEAVPIEGDMGESSRPLESEKLNDNMFSEYFAPCIKLALMFRQNTDDMDVVATNTDQYLYARLDRISAALIDSSRQKELLSFSSRDADLRISVTSAKTRLAVAVGNIQVDQQSLRAQDTKVPVSLAPTPVKLPQPTVQFLAWKDNIRSKSDMDSYEYVAIQVQEMDLRIEESWLYDVWDFYLDVMKKREARANLWQHNNGASFSTATFELEPSSNALEKACSFLKQDTKLKKKKIYIRRLILGFMEVNCSYFKSAKSSSWGGSESSEETLTKDLAIVDLFPSPTLGLNGQPGQQDDAYLKWSENMTSDVDETSQYGNINTIAAVFPSISEAPLKFEEKIIDHVYESEGDIWCSLKSFYSAEALRQIYKIAGSLDIVGNPTMVLTSFRTGLQDFFLQPSREMKHITKNPSRVGVGMLKGTLSLVSNSASGIFLLASNLGETCASTATMLTLDEHYQQLRSKQKVAQKRSYDRLKMKGSGRATMMISRPFHDIAFGVVSATSGLVSEPYRGAKENGLAGFTKGAGIGVIGVFAKPIVGLSDAFAHVMESIHDIAKSVNLLDGNFRPIKRYRLPYVFGSNQLLLPFDQVQSRSAQLLLSHPLEKKTKKGNEVIIASEVIHLGNGLEHYVVVTSMRVVLFRLKVVDGQGFITVNLVWQVRFERGARITSSLGSKGHNGSLLYVSQYSSQKQGDSKVADDDNIIPEETLHGDYFSVEGDGKYHNPDTPKSLYHLGATTATLKRASWPFTTGDGNRVTRFAIEGEFKQRLQLSRIHNAICCISGDFDSVISGENLDRSEGLTSFGPLIFEHTDQSLKHQVGQTSPDLSFLYSSLERTVWSCNNLKTYLFSDVLRNKCLYDNPSWLAEARSRGMSTSPLLPSIEDTAVSWAMSTTLSRTISELDMGRQASDSASQIVHSPTHQKIKQRPTEDERNIYDTQKAHSTSKSFPKSIHSKESIRCFEQLSAHEHDDFVNVYQSVENISTPPMLIDTNDRQNPYDKPMDENSSTAPIIDKSIPENSQIYTQHAPPMLLSPEIMYSNAETGSCLDDRLQRVEAMLEYMVGCDSSTADISRAERLQTYPTQISQTDHEHLNAVYSLNTLSDKSPPQGGGEEKVAGLLKEIDDLKKQLAAKNDSDKTKRLSTKKGESRRKVGRIFSRKQAK